MPKKVAREDWPVLIRDAHPGYISWDEFERNEQTLRDNVAGWSPRGSRSHAARGQRTFCKADFSAAAVAPGCVSATRR